MPIYEYECPKCYRKIEMLMKHNSIPPICCEPDCNVEMIKMMSTTNFALKGSCWARDGYVSKK